MEEIDLWRAARHMISLHADDAWLEAAQRADQFIAKGNPEGESAWKSILKAITELQSERLLGFLSP